MNVVGKVGSLISQGVYSVATPFHPFGGAVDAIVVQQQDGTFRSTPWYVRFGKFQGVLKGAEKIVRINVNGVEANFHMYLDNSGEAYFIREGDIDKESETNGILKNSNTRNARLEDGSIDDGTNENGGQNIVDAGRLEHSVSDSRVAQLRNEIDSLSADRIERSESDGDRRYYEFQDDQSSLEGSVELSEYGSNRYESFDGEPYGEPQGSDSEVILVSVDGHVLTAPILSSEQNIENLQLSTPQFHLRPGEGTEFCEDCEELNPGDNPWDANYTSEMNASAPNVLSGNLCSINNDINVQGHQHLEVCEGEVQHVCNSQGTQDIPKLEGDFHMNSDLEDASAIIKRKEVFRSCLELSELTKHEGNAHFEEMPQEIQNSPKESPRSLSAVNGTEYAGVDEIRNNDELSPPCNSDSPSSDKASLQVQVESIGKNSLPEEHTWLESISVHSVSSDTEWKEKQFRVLEDTMDGSLQSSDPEDECNKDEIGQPQTAISSGEIQTHSSIRFEISLCGKELRAGMGLAAAAEVFDAHRVSVEEFKNSTASIINNENLIIRFREMYLTWEKAAPVVLGMAAFSLDLAIEPKEAIPVEQDGTLGLRDGDTPITPTSYGRRWRLWPIPFRRVKTIEHTSSNSSSEEVFVDSESAFQNSQAETTASSQGANEYPHKQLIRTNEPTNEQIASLNLKEGQNMITFSFSTRVLGKQQVDAHIYLWKWNARIVISDVDGTITKSDVLGQFMPLVGKDWTQSGVAKLFCAIKENGYQLLFLSARAIVQAYLTRNFLFNLKQDGKTLPNGPVVISPDGLFPSLYREVIRRAPHEFKIACLEDIRKLFPSDYNPFYAGFGNRDTDELSYRKIGIPKGKIFIINPKGEVAISHCIDVKSYTSLHTLVNDMFPPTLLVEQEDYNSWNYWKVPLLDVE
ncbi:phosphatidate phosphatase PAH1-like isoform X1 [Tripterygium wilfordii]|uniref:phosphatidate phosphatase PAH1-like isoform X1 n=1 Tax=Tripterygium wilfordii TaxID=458696 RepID=UPI0018F85501|nr:phosphatidate phosphatase PAH1-like isoform X1 [Tripterygium wilfordii]